MPAMHKVSGRDLAIGNEIDRGLQSLMSDLESRDLPIMQRSETPTVNLPHNTAKRDRVRRGDKRL